MEAKKVVAVSPTSADKPSKVPLRKMYRELGIEPSALAVAKLIENLITGFVLDEMDANLEADIQGLNMRT